MEWEIVSRETITEYTTYTGRQAEEHSSSARLLALTRRGRIFSTLTLPEAMLFNTHGQLAGSRQGLFSFLTWLQFTENFTS